MHTKFLLATLEQARLGQGMCAPNPCVGAVAVQNGTIIAQAFHKGAGTAHAEQLVIEKIPDEAQEVSLYISLEPCNHWGRTPPCVDGIIDHGGINKVIFAYHDPNPIVANNNSSQKLQEKGIEVIYHPVDEINKFYQSYHYWTEHQKPWVTVKIAHSLNAKIGNRNAPRVHLSNEMCFKFTHQQRASTDIILSTANTINADNPQLNVRIEGKSLSRPVALIDTHLNINPDSKIFETAQHCYIYHHTKQACTYPNSSAYYINSSEQGLDLSAVISNLGKLGYHDVWVEAGASLFTNLHALNLVNTTFLYIVPTILEEDAISIYSQNLFKQPHTISWLPKGDNMIARIDWLSPNKS